MLVYVCLCTFAGRQIELGGSHKLLLGTALDVGISVKNGMCGPETQSLVGTRRSS